ncbi:putative GNAT family acetyltransferase [Aspergillus clavatus NRRL 1]|uniref:GNAT family acetyltransferase, putative n=1 Tax=Aspergillus clavatus (strain ATCC 1007 / CBS 513.65 / DSM 816 / NCTC 3887 / NRRL 1 / QM 1276 / 107) TaxID=344612 RepID=A1C9N1_ASPCL|nr:GNAT family acetyltransferase, putative [Aspergillus clavatus NRRL 1]EAW13555.1 GNAT family acetyltransferase, putative [Aspergillus clavatus NRRL 1]
MLLRPATAQDLPAIAEVAAQAMLDDELFEYLCPRRRKFYAEYRQSFMRRLRTKLLSPEWLVIVAVDTSAPVADGPHSSMSITGYAVWERIGEGAKDTVRQWKESDQAPWCDDPYISRLFPDRSVDNARLAAYNALSTECFPWAAYPNVWYLSVLAVHPHHQRQGIGRSLVEWGLEKARQEELPVGLEASAKGTSLYEQLGFRTVNEVQLMPGITMTAMLWVPNLEVADTSFD